jgi:uncharacterized protein HemX
MPGNNVNLVVTVLVALISGTGGWGVLQFVLNRTGRKAEIARQEAETERVKEETARDKSQLLSEVQITAQTTALESADRRYKGLEQDYTDQRKMLNELRTATWTLIETVDSLVRKMHARDESDEIKVNITHSDFLAIRAALAEARTHVR